MNLFDIAVQYHVNCERYDRTVCTGVSEHGSAMPTNNWEYRRINENAYGELARAQRLGREAHAAPEDVLQAIRDERVHREADRIMRSEQWQSMQFKFFGHKPLPL